MEVVSLTLPPTLRRKLLAAGFRTTADLEGIGPVELAREASISHEDALQVIKLVPQAGTLVAENAIAGAKSAWELLEYEKARRKITTFCHEVDKILGGGIATKEVTEICGVPGVGKTQLGMQLAVNVQTPVELGGLGGDAIYIDTEGSFMVERALEMAHSWLEELQQVVHAANRPDLAEILAHLTPDAILDRIFYFRVHDYTEQIALVNTLGLFLSEHPEVRLLVIDSVTFHFRQDFADMAWRTRLLNGMAQKLMAVADSCDVAVVLVNQVTLKVTGDTAKLVPALGESWSHASTNRIILFWDDVQRFCHLYKSPSLKSATAPFSVTSRGVRGSLESAKRQRGDESVD